MYFVQERLLPQCMLVILVQVEPKLVLICSRICCGHFYYENSIKLCPIKLCVCYFINLDFFLNYYTKNHSDKLLKYMSLIFVREYKPYKSNTHIVDNKTILQSNLLSRFKKQVKKQQLIADIQWFTWTGMTQWTSLQTVAKTFIIIHKTMCFK